MGSVLILQMWIKIPSSRRGARRLEVFEAPCRQHLHICTLVHIHTPLQMHFFPPAHFSLLSRCLLICLLYYGNSPSPFFFCRSVLRLSSSSSAAPTRPPWPAVKLRGSSSACIPSPPRPHSASTFTGLSGFLWMKNNLADGRCLSHTGGILNEKFAGGYFVGTQHCKSMT